MNAPECLCGCGQPTKGGKYLPGHDAKHVAWQFSNVKYGWKYPAVALAELPTPALHNKLVNKLWREGWTYDEFEGWSAPEGWVVPE